MSLYKAESDSEVRDESVFFEVQLLSFPTA